MKDSPPKKTKKTNNKKLSGVFKNTNLFYVGLALFILTSSLFIYLLYLFQQVNEIYVERKTYPEIKITSIPNFPRDNGAINASSEAYVVFDRESRSVLAGKNQTLRFSPASTAKIMTAIVSLERFNTEDFMTVPSLLGVEGSKMNLYSGEEIKVLDLLYGMMLPSGNDAAYTLAYNYPGGFEGFVGEMNRKAKELQLVNTHFSDPAGLEDSNYTTAIELARLASYAMQNETFREIVKTRQRVAYDKSFSAAHNLSNLNELLRYDNVIGVKTGFTNEAGGVLVTAVLHDGRIIIVVVLKSENRFYDTEDLMNFIDEKIEYSHL